MNKSPINVLSITTAQNTTLCSTGDTPAIADYQSARVQHLVASECTALGLIVTIMFEYGCRISEVLSISPTDITAKGHIVIKGTKKSSNRLIVLPQYCDYLLNIRHTGFNPFSSYDRFIVYRLLKKYNLSQSNQYGSKSAVCHQFRYSFAKDVNNVTNNIEETAKLIGHKNKNNTLIYVNR